MKIVNLIEFRKLPAGTLFSKYAPCVFDGLMIKGDTLESDFIYQDLIGNVLANDDSELFSILDLAEEDGKSFELDFDCSGRDGLFEENQMFAVYEQKDKDALISRLLRGD